MTQPIDGHRDVHQPDRTRPVAQEAGSSVESSDRHHGKSSFLNITATVEQVINTHSAVMNKPFTDPGNMMSLAQRDPRLWDLYTLKDEYLREDACKSFYLRENPRKLLEPVVSRQMHDSGYRLELPENKPFAVCLTHDIDDIYPPIHHRALASIYHLRKWDMGGLRREIFWKKDREGSYSYRNFREIMQIEDRYGAKSSFYVLATDRNIQPSRLYDVEVLERELGQIADAGWEVGLHGGYYSYDSAEAIRKEKQRLEKVLGRSVYGYRNHWLCIKVPDTWQHLAAAGFRYDSTVGYNDVPGFRNGMCYPFKPFNINSGSEIDIVEIPLAIMDCSLLGSYKSLSGAWETAKRLIDTVARYNGVITILWHNYVFAAAYRSDLKLLYEKILGYCHDKNAWITTGKEISKLRGYYIDRTAGQC